jgi:predicted RNA binding protein YcfA (HicA-like mRNA interferase family)
LAKRQKILDKVLTGSQNVRFEEFLHLLEGFGFVLERVRGSHHLLSREGVPEMLSVQPRKDGKAKPYQVKQFLKIVEQYDLQLDEGEE